MRSEADGADAGAGRTVRRGTLDANSNPAMRLDDGGRIVEANEALRRLTGQSGDDLVGSQAAALALDPDALGVELRTVAEAGVPRVFTARLRHRDGHATPVVCTVTRSRRPDGAAARLLLIAHDTTTRRELQEQLARHAFHDPLTGLPNRSLFGDRLRHALARTGRSGRQVAVLFLDLDRFKTVNDSLGHAAGDQLLLGVAGRLRECVRPGDTVARFAGDEFTVLLEEVPDADVAMGVARRIEAALRAPFEVGGTRVFTSASIGIAIGGPSAGGDQGVDLVRDADVAMYRSKANGRARHEVFDPAMLAEAADRLDLENDLRLALERGEFALHYQPKVLLVTGHVFGLEALLRWRHPRRGLVSPGEFIPLAEETGLILPIGEWVLTEACRQMRAFKEAHPTVPLSWVGVNLSARQFAQADLVGQVERVLAETGLDPRHLDLEITESAAMGDGGASLRTLHALRGLGVELSIDDFGAGYSSLAYLKRLPVTSLKIDRTFVAESDRTASDVVLEAIIKLGRALHLKVTAEGVETEDQLAVLREYGCDLAQGYLFSPPLPPEEVGPFLERFSTADGGVVTVAG